jgi:biopolymer transport protein ExbD
VNFRRSSDDDLQINLTPLIDVVFLLLIFFMVTTTFTKESQLRIELPEASTQQKLASEEKLLTVDIGPKGEIMVKGRLGLVRITFSTRQEVASEARRRTPPTQ